MGAETVAQRLKKKASSATHTGSNSNAQRINSETPDVCSNFSKPPFSLSVKQE